MPSADLLSLYRNNLPTYEKIEKSAKEIIIPFCEKEHFLFEGRIKKYESLLSKVETGRYSCWSEIDDIYACTIVITLPEDENKVLAFLDENFQINPGKTRYKGHTNKPADVFRYDSTRATCQLKRPAHIDASESVYTCLFEIQIRTIFEYSWAKTTHALSYKAATVDWKRMRLAAQLKAATEQIETLILAFEETSSFIGQSKNCELEDKTKIHLFFKKYFEKNIFPEEAEPSNWILFADNIYKIIQIINNESPTGRSSRELKNLDTILEEFDKKIMQNGAASYPMSLSLFQFTSAILIENKGNNPIKKQKTYYFFNTKELESIFLDLKIPSEKFGFT
ncbi:hypothetical protein [Pseudomonas oryzihabitans]|uniref:hypothetical protein n=1 Tax=Pseudomonas oryzihabitans TaxID=47885 RepID=UPI0015E2F71D|nr:hypothetical protein [Pseudomonas psychrotolerans]MBA1260296.1 hypothetical protein [Pseudomonas psychrotolerans]